MAFSLLFIVCGVSEHNRFKAATDAAMSALQIREYCPYKNAFNENPGVTLLKWTQWFLAPLCCFFSFLKSYQTRFLFLWRAVWALPAPIHNRVRCWQKETYSLCHLHERKQPKAFFCWFWIHLCQEQPTGDLIYWWVWLWFSLTCIHVFWLRCTEDVGSSFSFSCSCLALSHLVCTSLSAFWISLLLSG